MMADARKIEEYFGLRKQNQPLAHLIFRAINASGNYISDVSFGRQGGG
jgi:hypothetical protein